MQGASLFSLTVTSLPTSQLLIYVHSHAIQLAQKYSYINPDLYDISFDLT